LICERCQLVHPADFDGLTCRNPGCGGKLIPVEIQFDSIERKDDDEPIIAS